MGFREGATRDHLKKSPCAELSKETPRAIVTRDLGDDAAREPFGRDVIHEIALADLKERFLDRLENGLGTVFQPLPEPFAEEIEVDTIF